MGLFQDQTNSLPEIKRLAALVSDPSRRAEIGCEQWPLAMVAYSLATCNHANNYEQGIEIYRTFQSCCTMETREQCLWRLAEFVCQRQGDGWRALLPFILAETDVSICRQSVFLIVTLAPITNIEKMTGVATLIDIIKRTDYKQISCSAIILESLLNLGDMRLMSYLQSISTCVPISLLQELLRLISPRPSDLACKWLITLMQKYPELCHEGIRILSQMPLLATEVTDEVIPIPSWQFKNNSVQVLHAWTLPEYVLRMKKQLDPIVSCEQWQTLARFWQNSH